MDNLPNDPSNPNSNNFNPPLPFGSNFNPHVNPIDPSNPYVSQPPQPSPPPSPNTPNTPEPPDAIKHEHYSEAAHHKIRDEHGRFIHPQTPLNPSVSPNPQNPPNSPNSFFLPPIIEVNQNTEPSKKEDPPLFGFFITNPVTYLKSFCLN